MDRGLKDTFCLVDQNTIRMDDRQLLKTSKIRDFMASLNNLL